MISVLIADDEEPALDELEYLLGADARVGTIHRASSGADAVRLLARESVDAVFLDIHMPGLSGFDLARALARFEQRPVLVFVTADEERALDAFELAALDYLLKPVRAQRLSRCVQRIIEALHGPPEPERAASDLIAVSVGTTTRMIRRDEVRFVQAQGDYARLHTDDGSHLVRVPISDLERQWAGVGFLRVHRSYLVSLPHVSRLRLGTSHPSVTVAGRELPVSRRLLPALRDALESVRIRPRA